jgi:transcription antitermination factor NusG
MALTETYRWYAVHTKFKCEKFVRDQLASKGIQAYVPVLRVRKQYTRKVKVYDKPLINCYAFVLASQEEYRQILQTPYVFDFVRFGGRIQAIPEQEMQLMQRVVGEQDGVRFEPREWARGDRVAVSGGNRTGLQGILLDRNGKKEFTVALETIGFRMHMVIEDKYLRKVANAPAEQERQQGPPARWAI